MSVKASPIADRVWPKVNKTPGGCWLWTASLDRHGYGQVRPAGGGMAHRVVYELVCGPIPEGLDLDHLCRNRACVNPDHLEPVTRRENLVRGAGFVADNARKTHCLRGHAYDAGNTRRRRGKPGHRSCRQCVLDKNRKGGGGRRETCKRGHTLAVEAHERADRKGRECRACHRARYHERNARKAAGS